MTNAEPMNLLLVIDDALRRGIEKGFYNNSNPILPRLNGNVEYLPAGPIPKDKYIESQTSQLKEGELYLYNPFNETYYELNEDIYDNFIRSKHLRIEELLVRMGAKYYEYLIEENILGEREVDVNGNIKTKQVEMSTGIQYQRKQQEQKQYKVQTRSSGIQKVPHEELIKLQKKYCLEKENDLNMLLNLYRDKFLEQDFSREISMSMSTEVDYLLDISFQLSATPLFELKSSVKRDSKTKKEIIYKMRVEF